MLRSRKYVSASFPQPYAGLNGELWAPKDRVEERARGPNLNEVIKVARQITLYTLFISDLHTIDQTYPFNLTVALFRKKSGGWGPSVSA